jgi:hypothetical protein
MQWDKEASKEATQKSIERIKSEDKKTDSESVWFEDGSSEIILLDGKKYKIFPVNLKKARRLLQLLKTVNVDMAIANFIPSGDEELDNQREKDFFEMVQMAFEKYDLSKEYLEENVDVVNASNIANTLLGINGIKK